MLKKLLLIALNFVQICCQENGLLLKPLKNVNPDIAYLKTPADIFDMLNYATIHSTSWAKNQYSIIDKKFQEKKVTANQQFQHEEYIVHKKKGGPDPHSATLTLEMERKGVIDSVFKSEKREKLQPKSKKNKCDIEYSIDPNKQDAYLHSEDLLKIFQDEKFAYKQGYGEMDTLVGKDDEFFKKDQTAFLLSIITTARQLIIDSGVFEQQMGSAQGLNGNRKEVKKLQCRYGGWVKLIFGKQNEKYSRYDL